MAVYVRAALLEAALPEMWGVFAFCKINYVVFPTKFKVEAPAERWREGEFGICISNSVVKTT